MANRWPSRLESPIRRNGLVLERLIDRLVPMASEEPVVKPLDGLEEGLLPGEPLHLVGRVAPNAESVDDTGVEVYLVGFACLLENLFGFVSFVSGEDAISLRGGDGERSGDAFQFLLLDKGRMREVADVDARPEMANDVLVEVSGEMVGVTEDDVPWRQSSTRRRRSS